MFPELVRRILGQEDVVNLKDCNVTVFQFVQFLEEMEANEEIGDLSKVVDKLALESKWSRKKNSGASYLELNLFLESRINFPH